MAQIDPESKAYQDARERLYEYVRSRHSEPLGYIEAVQGAQAAFAAGVRKEYEKNLGAAQAKQFGPYRNPDYTEGAIQGVRDWALQVAEGERVRHKARQRALLGREW